MPFSGGLRRRRDEARPATVADVAELVQLTCGLPSAGPTIGAEIEWLVVDLIDRSRRPTVAELEGALSELPLPGGSRLSFEPGGQAELSSRPGLTPDETHSRVLADLAVLRPALRARGLDLVAAASDPVRLPMRVSDSPRYRAMEQWFAAGGWSAAPQMMCNTASIQVNVGCGPDPSRSWRAANALAPVLAAMFATSPGNGWASERLRAWAALDPSRTSSAFSSGDPITDWTEFALSALALMRADSDGTVLALGGRISLREWLEHPPRGWPIASVADVALHLSTLFPPVRLKGWLEIRVIDMPPGDLWPVPLAVTSALLAPAPAATEPDLSWLEDVADLTWQDAARLGLGSPALADAADRALRVAHARLADQGSRLAPEVERYRIEHVASRLPRAAAGPAV